MGRVRLLYSLVLRKLHPAQVRGMLGQMQRCPSAPTTRFWFILGVSSLNGRKVSVILYRIVFLRRSQAIEFVTGFTALCLH
jgi:hypothetical protein